MPAKPKATTMSPAKPKAVPESPAEPKAAPASPAKPKAAPASPAEPKAADPVPGEGNETEFVPAETNEPVPVAKKRPADTQDSDNDEDAGEDIVGNPAENDGSQGKSGPRGQFSDVPQEDVDRFFKK